jgi:DEAD/DEAH box helicase domain-containing protein
MERDKFFNWWPNSEPIRQNITAVKVFEPHQGDYYSFPDQISPEIVKTLKSRGITSLYSHQVESLQQAESGKNIVITTGTSSGKTLCYNLAVLDRFLRFPGGSALYVFPTKALANDQVENMRGFIADLNRGFPHTQKLISPDQVSVYDGDTPASSRSGIRSRVRVLVTNPDMIHLGILPHHTLWQDFFSKLGFIVLDEIHLYRGVFGSHVANTIRRLKRVVKFYGNEPQFFLTSATIANAAEHAEKLIGKPATQINQDGSPHGKRTFVLYNPPIVNEDLGIRRSSISECNLIGMDLFMNKIQTIIFSRSRREVEVILQNFLDIIPLNDRKKIRGYRAGYLPKHRREIESGLRSGEILTTVSTNALELGIDIGGMDAIILVGYPGSIASVRQQVGRAGRRHGDSLAIFLATYSPLDQYLVNHPEYLFERSPEQALIDPDNLLILLAHLKAAAFEMPFKKGECFGDLSSDQTREFLDYLAEEGFLVSRDNGYFWLADAYPASQVSLRNASPSQITLLVPQGEKFDTIGIVDYNSSLWMVHSDAIYLQEGQQYRVETLDLENGQAILIPGIFDYFTLPHQEIQINVQLLLDHEEIKGGEKSFGEIHVVQQIKSYKKIRWENQEVEGVFPLIGLPPTDLLTTGYWFQFNDDSVEFLKSQGMWSSEPNRYGKDWERIRQAIRRRDKFICQSCGKVETTQEFHVHHRIPFRQFTRPEEANRFENLVTLCPTCHMKAESNLRIRSGLGGCRYALSNLAPLFLMCDQADLGSVADPICKFTNGQPAVIFYDQVPGGIGFSEHLYKHHVNLLDAARELILNCTCKDGCPACVGASGYQAEGGKPETLSLLNCLLD